MNFLQLPFEIRVQVYRELFGQGIATVQAGRQDTGHEARRPSLLPARPPTSSYSRSSQILRTCRTILLEAQPILYDNTIFRTSLEAFAGRLPVQLSNSNPVHEHAQHIEWSLYCDILKRFDENDVQISATDVGKVQTIELSCQAENWINSYSGDLTERQAFLSGRKQMIALAQCLATKMKSTGPVVLAENSRHVSRGRISLRLCRKRRNLHPDDLILT